MMVIDLRSLKALLTYSVRERTHPECPPEKRFVSRFPDIPGEWASRGEAEQAVIAFVVVAQQKEDQR